MLLDFADLSSGNGEALYQKLYEQIKTAVNGGIIGKGERLPSIREAAAQLLVSRTTVENAYMKLCIEGIAESLPQRGYFICGTGRDGVKYTMRRHEEENPVIYDFSTQKIDTSSADSDVWKKTVRSVLRDTKELTSYGDSQGEPGLREALAAYSYKARGVRCGAENIVIGAGVGPLLNILCGLTGRNVKVGIENGGFNQAVRIFSDYGIESVALPYDNEGATVNGLLENEPDILFLLPSALPKISVPSLSKRRNSYVKWAGEKPGRLIIEDDYNGELRYTARSVTAFQGKCPEKTVYIGSFSKLLLPSVRIAYMVLPDGLSEEFAERKKYYNQTCGKIEQLALEDYIVSGALEKHLRRLRKLYYEKSRVFCRAINDSVSSIEELTLYESSLTVRLKTSLGITGREICRQAEKCGIRLIPTDNIGEIRLCFAGIQEKDINISLQSLNRFFEKLKDKK